jgi:hypothetical protein
VDHSWKARALAVLAASVYVYLLVRIAPEAALIVTPALPFTSVGVADHLSERRRERERSEPDPSGSNARP